MPSLRKKVSGILRQIPFTATRKEMDEEELASASVPTDSLRHPRTVNDVISDYRHPSWNDYGQCSTLAEGAIRNGYQSPHNPPPAPSTASGLLSAREDSRAMHASLVHMYLTGRLKKRSHPDIYHGKTGIDLPVLQIAPLARTVYASQTGPDGGLTQVSCVNKRPLVKIANLDDELKLSLDAGINLLSSSSCGSTRTNVITGTGTSARGSPGSSVTSACGLKDTKGIARPSLPAVDWTSPHPRACGLSTSLYERHPHDRIRSGDPVADVFAVCARPNSCILALADGVNWGERSRLAARCAVRGSVEHLIDSLYDGQNAVSNSADVFRCLLRAFHSGHHLILQEGGSLTTLCVVIVCQLKDSPQWLLCSCNVGDSLAFVFSEKYGVREVTLGSHDIQQMRDMRDAGGALGPVDGVNPELHNFTCAMTIVDEHDWVFLTSDGVSDNFDPVVGKFCFIRDGLQCQRPMNMNNGKQETEHDGVPKTGLTCLKSPVTARRMENTAATPPGRKAHSLRVDSGGFSNEIISHLPLVEAYQRHELMLLRMEHVIRRRNFKNISPSKGTSLDVCEALLEFAVQLTSQKRNILEDPGTYRYADDPSAQKEHKQRRRFIRQRIAAMPGKLDHATVVAYRVGQEKLDKHRSTSAESAVQTGLSVIEMRPAEDAASATSPECHGLVHADDSSINYFGPSATTSIKAHKPLASRSTFPNEGYQSSIPRISASLVPMIPEVKDSALAVIENGADSVSGMKFGFSTAHQSRQGEVVDLLSSKQLNGSSSGVHDDDENICTNSQPTLTLGVDATEPAAKSDIQGASSDVPVQFSERNPTDPKCDTANLEEESTMTKSTVDESAIEIVTVEERTRSLHDEVIPDSGCRDLPVEPAGRCSGQSADDQTRQESIVIIRDKQDRSPASGRLGGLSKALGRIERAVKWKHRENRSLCLDQPEWREINEKCESWRERRTASATAKSRSKEDCDFYCSSQSTPRRMPLFPWGPVRAFRSWTFRGFNRTDRPDKPGGGTPLSGNNKKPSECSLTALFLE